MGSFSNLRLALFTICGILTGISWVLNSLYYGIAAFLGWRAYAVFVPLAGILAWVLVFLDSDTE